MKSPWMFPARQNWYGYTSIRAHTHIISLYQIDYNHQNSKCSLALEIKWWWQNLEIKKAFSCKSLEFIKEFTTWRVHRRMNHRCYHAITAVADLGAVRTIGKNSDVDGSKRARGFARTATAPTRARRRMERTPERLTSWRYKTWHRGQLPTPQPR